MDRLTWNTGDLVLLNPKDQTMNITATLPAAFIPSAKQQAIFDFVESGHGSAVVIAVAGSGKTKTIERCLPLIPETKFVQLFAFNAIIAKELKSRIELLAVEFNRPFQRFSAKTFHSVGFGAVCKKLNARANQFNTDGNKLRKLFERNVSPEEFEIYSSFVPKLVSYAKGAGVGPLISDNRDAWRDLISHHDLTLDSLDGDEEQGIDLARELLNLSNRAARDDKWIDFDDMLYLPLLWRLSLWQNDFVFIDESQDTSPVRRAIAKLSLRAGGRLIAVGDPKQAIYGFTGATHDAIDTIKAEFNTCELPLTVSYRCSQAVGALAQSIVPYFEVHEGAVAGAVSHLSLDDALKQIGPKDAILCRNTKPLVQLAYTLIARGTACHVLGSEIGKGLVSLVRKMKAKDIDGLLAKLTAYREREVAKFMAKGEEGRAEGVNDRCDCIEIFVGALDESERTIAKLLLKIEGLFSDNTNQLTLSTVHKAKGREWNTVAILEPELMPSKYARQAWQAEQEENLKYVAFTRAQTHLIFLEG